MEPETIELPLDIAEGLKQALTSALYFSQATDLLDGYRQLKPNIKLSPMTKQIQTQIELLQSWIDLAQAEEEVSDDDESGNSDA